MTPDPTPAKVVHMALTGSALLAYIAEHPHLFRNLTDTHGEEDYVS